MNEDGQLLQIKIGKIFVVIVIITLIHSLYLLNVEEKRIKDEPTISRLESSKQSLINSFVILIVTVIYLFLEFKNYIELKRSNASCEQIIEEKARLAVFILAFLSILIDVIISINNYYNQKRNIEQV